MKLALRYIDKEVWVADVFCFPWISRKQLGKIVHRLRNRKFAKILQYCLHERGKRTLGELILGKEAIIPRTPLPENIKFFDNIRICHFDSSTLVFLRLINALFNEVNLRFKFFNEDMTKFRTMLDPLAPMLNGIHSLAFDRSAIPLVQQHFALKLAKVKLLTIVFGFAQLDQATLQTSIDFCLDWLTSEEQDPAEPRLLRFDICGAEIFQQFSTAIRQQFLLAQTPRTFAIEFLCYYGNRDQVATFHLKNNVGEQLDGQFEEDGDFRIYRHKQVDSAKTQLQEWIIKTMEKSDSSSGIEFYQGTSIGQIDGNAGNNGMDDNAGKEEEDGPSTSKKPN